MLCYIFNFKISIMTSKGVPHCVQYPAGQLSRDTYHIKSKRIRHKSEHKTQTEKAKENTKKLIKMTTIDYKLEKVVFELLDHIPHEDFKTGFEELEPIVDDWIFKEAILAMIPNGKLRLRKFKFLETISAEDFRMVLNEYYLDLLNTEAVRRML